MSLSVTVEIKDDAIPPLLRLSQAVQRPDVRMVMGRAMADQIKRHFIQLEGERANKLGGARTNFYGRAAGAVQQPELVGGDGVKVSINQIGIAQRYFGGDIVPRTAQWLTIPARAEAYGRRARDFHDLHFVFFRDGLAALIQNDQSSLGGRGSQGLKGTETGGGVFFWLVKRAHQEADPTVLPTSDELQTTALDSGEAYMQTLLDRSRN